MKAIFNNSHSLSGVYKIYNKLKDRTYYGSAKKFIDRYDAHIRLLKNKEHFNVFLQNDFNKCGIDNFIFEVLELTLLEERFIMEQIYLDQYHDNQTKCYNVKKQAIQDERSCHSLTPEETSKKISNSLQEHYSNPNNRKKISNSLKGKKKPPFTLKHRQSMSKAKIGTKISDNAKIKMSDSHKTPEALLRLKNTYEIHRDSIIARQSLAVSRKHILINSDGVQIEIINLSKFCRENKMHANKFRKTKDVNIPSYKGWRYVRSEEK